MKHTNQERMDRIVHALTQDTRGLLAYRRTAEARRGSASLKAAASDLNPQASDAIGRVTRWTRNYEVVIRTPDGQIEYWPEHKIDY